MCGVSGGRTVLKKSSGPFRSNRHTRRRRQAACRAESLSSVFVCLWLISEFYKCTPAGMSHLLHLSSSSPSLQHDAAAPPAAAAAHVLAA